MNVAKKKLKNICFCHCVVNLQQVLGFVEELVVEDDPEFEWHAIRAARTSNENRQSLLHSLHATVTRQLGKKVRDHSFLLLCSFFLSFFLSFELHQD